MEIGNVAEWVAALAKMIAIIGAIVLPIVNERKKTKNSIKRLARREYELTIELMDERHERNQPLPELESYEQLKSFIGMLMIVSDDDELIKISDQLTSILDRPTDAASFDHSINEVLNRLKRKYVG